MSKLAEFLTQLAEDADLQDKYKADPEKTMRGAGLSDDEIKAVMAGDAGKIKELTGNADSMIVIFHHRY